MEDIVRELSQGNVSIPQILENISSNASECINNVISIYGKNASKKPYKLTEWNFLGKRKNREKSYISEESCFNIDITNRESVILEGLLSCNIKIPGKIKNLLLVDCKDICIEMENNPIVGLSFLRCVSIFVRVNNGYTSLVESEYTFNMRLESRVNENTIVRSIGSESVWVNGQNMNVNVWGSYISMTEGIRWVTSHFSTNVYETLTIYE